MSSHPRIHLARIMVVVFSAIAIFLVFAPAHAQVKAGLDAAAGAAGLPGQKSGDLSTAIGAIISGVMGLVGSIMFLYMLYGGFRWMIAGGDTKAVSEAQTIIRNAIIGIAIIIFAYTLSSFVITQLSSVAGSAPSTAGTTSATAKACGSGDAAGYSCVDSSQSGTCSITLDTAVYLGCGTNQVCCKQ